MQKNNNFKWFVVISVILLVGFFSIIVAAIFGLLLSAGGNDLPSDGNVAVIPLKGTILTEDATSVFDSGYVSSSQVVRAIENADQDSRIQAIVLEINSPGGSPVASDEIANAVKKCEKPVVAWIREVGASGGYYVASAADHIIAHKMAITGSIGVISSYLQFSGLLDDYNVTYERLIAGDLKDMGSPFKELTPEERAKLQTVLDTIHEMFIEEVAGNRNMSYDAVAELATGETYLGVTAVELGLIDEVGGKEEVVHHLESEENISVDFAYYRSRKTIIDLFGEVMHRNSYFIGQGIGSRLLGKQKPLAMI